MFEVKIDHNQDFGKFVEWMKKSGYNEMEGSLQIYKYEPRDLMLSAWQAATELAAKRERERIAQQLGFMADKYDDMGNDEKLSAIEAAIMAIKKIERTGD